MPCIFTRLLIHLLNYQCNVSYKKKEEEIERKKEAAFENVLFMNFANIYFSKNFQSKTENSVLDLQRRREREGGGHNSPAESKKGPKVKRDSNCIIFQTKRTNKESPSSSEWRSPPNYVQV